MIKHRPLFWTAIAFLIGVSLPSLSGLDHRSWLVACAVPGVAGLTLLLRNKAPLLHAPALYLFAALLGAAHGSVQSVLSRDHILDVCPLEGRALARLEGEVSDRPRMLQRKEDANALTGRGVPFTMTQFRLSSLSVEAEGGDRARFSGDLRVSVNDALREVRYGDRVSLLGWVSRPGLPRNPGEFNPRRFLARRGIHVQVRIQQPKNVLILSRGHGSKLRGLLLRLNVACQKALHRTLAERDAALLDALILGNRDSVSESQEEDFIATGTRHVLAISGLHVGLITAGVVGLLLALSLPVRIAHPIAILFAFFYAFFTGGATPSVRAAVMVGVFLLGPLFSRRSDPLNLLGLSALLIVGFDASQLFSAGFQLSFSAVLGILLLADELHVLFRRKSLFAQLTEKQRRYSWRRVLARYAAASVCVSGAAWIATLGLTAYYFNRISPLAVVANLAVYPLVFVLLQVGMLSFLLTWLIPPLGTALLMATGFLAACLQGAIHLIAQAPLGRVYVPDPSLLLIVLSYLFLILFVNRQVLRLPPRRLAALAGIFLAIGLIHTNLNREDQRGRMTLSVLNVGHGCASFLELPDGSSLLYDVGARGYSDVTRRSVAPFLWRKGLTHIDRVIVSHLDADHYSGLQSLLERFRVSELVLTPESQIRSTGKAILRLAKENGAAVSFAAAGQVLAEGPGWKVEVLNPPEGVRNALFLSDNDLSLVLRATLGKVAFLLCGDIQEEGVSCVESDQDRLRADVILVPHHGGRMERTEDLIRWVKPRFAAVSAWANGPAESTLEAYRRHGAKIHVTGRANTAFYSTDGSQVIYSGYGGE